MSEERTRHPDSARYRELERQVRVYEQPDGKFRHWLLLSIESESPEFDEAVDEQIEKRRGGR